MSITSSATISLCGTYRYRLARAVAGGQLRVLFVGLNPSTADHQIDDPTVRRMMSFAALLGGGELQVGNLFAYRAVQPSELWRVGERVAIGPENDRHLASMAQGADIIVAAWGTSAERSPRAGAVLKILKASSQRAVLCLGRTKEGWPRHPLYLPKTAQAEVY